MKVAVLIVKVAVADEEELNFGVLAEDVTRKLQDDLNVDYAQASVMATADVVIPDRHPDWAITASDSAEKLANAIGIRFVGRIQ